MRNDCATYIHRRFGGQAAGRSTIRRVLGRVDGDGSTWS